MNANFAAIFVTVGLDLSVGTVGVSSAMTCRWLAETLPLALVGALALGRGGGI